MSTRFSTAAILLGGLGVAASLTGCFGPRCSASDKECFLENMVFMEPVYDGEAIPTFDVQNSFLGSTGAPESSPAITTLPPPIALGEPAELAPLQVGWVNPHGCRPSFCARICDENGSCTFGFRCTEPKSGAGSSGTWLSYFGLLADLRSDDFAHFQVGLTPVSAPGCPADLANSLQTAASSMVTGPEVRFSVSIGDFESPDVPVDPPVDPPDDPDFQCSTWSNLCSCSYRACAEAGTTCWYETTMGGRIDCDAGCDCSAASASAVASCCDSP